MRTLVLQPALMLCASAGLQQPRVRCAQTILFTSSSLTAVVKARWVPITASRLRTCAIEHNSVQAPLLCLNRARNPERYRKKDFCCKFREMDIRVGLWLCAAACWGGCKGVESGKTETLRHQHPTLTISTANEIPSCKMFLACLMLCDSALTSAREAVALGLRV
jgi:hypothetical protein